MNEILQKRIEEAATFLFKQRGLDKESCRQAMYYILANQWISVEEALPERLENENVSDYVFVSNKNWVDVFRYDFKNNNWLDYVNNTHWGITHWMPIPSLKGGEK
jgi:hypothetical protein